MKQNLPTFLFIASLLLLNTFSHISAETPSVSTAKIVFYAETLSVDYSPTMFVPLGSELNDKTFYKFYNDLDKTAYHVLLGNLFYHKKELALNDWLYYLLINQAAKTIFANETETYRTLFCWFMLSKTGYKVQLNYSNEEVLISVYTNDEVFELPVAKEGNGWNVDITTALKAQVENRFMSRSMNSIFTNLSLGKPFSFEMLTLPNFSNPEIVSKQLSFIHDNESYTLDVDINKNVLYTRWRYPQLSIFKTSKIPLSQEAVSSLIPAFSKLLRTKTNYDALRMILSFTRQTFKYKTDMEAYKTENLTFCAEETLFYTNSDCEDRAILFKYLVTELLHLDVILVNYPDHATCAVALPQTQGKPILYKNKEYTICDPTGPGNHLKPGDYPEGLENTPYTIISN